MASDDPFKVPARGIHHRSDIESRTAARNAEIGELMASGASEDVVAARIADAVAAHEADKAALDASFAALTANLVTGWGTPRMEVVEGLLGTPQGDESAALFGFGLGDFTTEQIMAMKANGLSWQEINARCVARRHASGR